MPARPLGRDRGPLRPRSEAAIVRLELSGGRGQRRRPGMSAVRRVVRRAGGVAALLVRDHPVNQALETSMLTDGSLSMHVRVDAGGSVAPASTATVAARLPDREETR